MEQRLPSDGVMGPEKSPTVFISYSHDSPAHSARVLAFADRLRADDVDARLDRYEPGPSTGWPLWSEQWIVEADFVIIVCTETYKARFNQDAEPRTGRGVKWEGALVRQMLYDADMNGERFIPVVFDRADETHVPIVLGGLQRYVVSDEAGYQALYRRLTNQPGIEKPGLAGAKAIGRGRRLTRPFVAAVALMLFVCAIVLVIVAIDRSQAERRGASVSRENPVLRGQVVEAGTNAPIAGADVLLPGLGLKATTDRHGMYAFSLEGHRNQAVSLQIVKDGFQTVYETPTVAGGHADVHQMKRLR
jgi:hypothetical protein